MKVSIIIPCRNEEAFIHDCVTSVLEFQNSDVIVQEILIIDGMSTDNTKKKINNIKCSTYYIKKLTNLSRYP